VINSVGMVTDTHHLDHADAESKHGAEANTNALDNQRFDPPRRDMIGPRRSPCGVTVAGLALHENEPRGGEMGCDPVLREPMAHLDEQERHEEHHEVHVELLPEDGHGQARLHDGLARSLLHTLRGGLVGIGFGHRLGAGGEERQHLQRGRVYL